MGCLSVLVYEPTGSSIGITTRKKPLNLTGQRLFCIWWRIREDNPLRMKGQGNQRVGARKAKFSYEELRLTDSITDVATASIHTRATVSSPTFYEFASTDRRTIQSSRCAIRSEFRFGIPGIGDAAPPLIRKLCLRSEPSSRAGRASRSGEDVLSKSNGACVRLFVPDLRFGLCGLVCVRLSEGVGQPLWPPRRNISACQASGSKTRFC